MTANEPNRTLTPHDALRLVDHESRAHDARLSGPVPAILIVWGVAWAAIYLLLWASDGVLPALVAYVGAAVALVLAIAASGVLGARIGRGIRASKDAAFTGAVYGSSWTIGILGLGAIGAGLHAHGMSDELLLLFAAVAYAFLSGFQYVAAAAIWHAVPMLVLGVWLVALAAVAVFLATSVAMLVLAIGGGVPLLGLGIAQAVRMRRSVTS